MEDLNSLSHTRWNCKYHIVFAPKYRRQVIYGKIKQDIGQMLRKLCEYKGTEIIEERRTKIMFTYWKVSRPSTAFHRLWGVERGKIV